MLRWLTPLLIAVGCTGTVEPTETGDTADTGETEETGEIEEPSAVDDLDEAKTRWESFELDNYQYEFSVSCECAGPYEFTVTVVGGEVDTVEYVSTDEDDPNNIEYANKTIDDWFDVIEGALSGMPDDANISYDAIYSYPTSIFIDYDVDLADEELSVTITSFEPSDLD